MSRPTSSGESIRAAIENPLVSKAEYRPDIDGLRAISILAVVFSHAGLLHGNVGWVGVDIFFVISGYLISGIIFRGLSRGTFGLLDFYSRRAKRLFPALIIVLLSAWGLCWLLFLPDEFQRLGRDLITGSSYIQNLFVYAELREPLFEHLTPFHTRHTLTHLWSLSVEEQFYLLWPILLLAGYKSRTRLTLPIAIFAVASISFFLNVAATTKDVSAAYFLPWNRLWELAMGGGLAYMQVNSPAIPHTFVAPASLPRARDYRREAIALLSLLLVILSAFFQERPKFFGSWQLIPTVGTCALIWAGPDTWASRYILSTRPMVFIGLISYPLYLWHQPLIFISHAANWPISYTSVTLLIIALSVILSYITYKYVELPIRSSSSTLRTASALVVAVAACAGLGYATNSKTIPARSHPQDVELFIQATTDYTLPTVADSFRIPTLKKSLAIGAPRKRTLFMGDSTVKSYYHRVHQILLDHPQNSRGAVFSAWEECDPWLRHFPDRKAACDRLSHETIEYAESSEIDTVVIGGCWYCRFAHALRFDTVSPLKPGTDDELQELAGVITHLHEIGKRVYIVLDVPMGSSFDPRSSIQRNLPPQAFTITSHTTTLAEVRRMLDPIRSKVTALAQLSGAHLIDPVEYLCSEVTCPSLSQDGFPAYRDSMNLRPQSVRQSATYIDQTVLDDGRGHDDDLSNDERACTRDSRGNWCR